MIVLREEEKNLRVEWRSDVKVVCMILDSKSIQHNATFLEDQKRN